MSGPTVGTEFIVHAPHESQAMARYNGQRGRVTGFCGTIICEIDGGGEVRLSEPLWTSSTLLLERPAGPKVGDEFEWRTSPKLRGKVTKVLLDGFQALFRDGSDRFLAMARWSECFPVEKPSAAEMIGLARDMAGSLPKPTDPRDAEIARLKSELEAEGAKTRGPDGRTFKDLLGSIATFRERNHLLEAEERRLRFDLASKDREIAKLKLAVKERGWRR